MRRACSRAPRNLRRDRFNAYRSRRTQARNRAGSICFRGKWHCIFLQSPGNGGELWQLPELLRVKGELVLLQGGAPQAAAAENYFQRALDWARRQGASSWELRAAASLARLLRDQGRSAEAVALLQPVYDCFTEGFDTVDLKAAKALLDALQ